MALTAKFSARVSDSFRNTGFTGAGLEGRGRAESSQTCPGASESGGRTRLAEGEGHAQAGSQNPLV